MQRYEKFPYPQHFLQKIHTFSTQKIDSQLWNFQHFTNPDKKYFRIFATVKKWMIILLLFTGLVQAAAQQKKANPQGVPMYYIVEDGDTLFVDSIDPVWVMPRGRKMKKDDWRKQYKLIYNFNKVYPFALAGSKMMAQVDSVIAADATKRSQRNAYTRDVMFELFDIFGKDIKNMTISQGVLLMRLVDRECGIPPYEIIKEYRSSFSARFWQMIARLFGQNLKRRYDPTGDDAKTEELVKKWNSGEWDAFYYSVFFDYPKKTKIKRDYLKSTVKSREDKRKVAEEAELMRKSLKEAKEML